MAEQTQENIAPSLREYLNVVWGRKWIVLAVVVLATAAAFFNAARKTPVYRTSTTMMYDKALDVANPLSTTGSYFDVSQVALEIEGVGTVIRNADIVARVQQAMGGAIPGGYSVSTSTPVDQNDSRLLRTNLVTLTVQGPDPQVAADLANAYVQAYMDWRTERQDEKVGRAMSVIKGRLRTYRTRASKLTSDYVLLKQSLQDFEILRATMTGDFQLVSAAVAPGKPIEPRPWRAAALGFAVGLFAGIGLAFLLEQLDTSLNDHREAAEILQMPVIGRIPKIEKRALHEDGLIVVTHPDGSTAEAFRLLRGNLQFINVDGGVKSLFIASCVAGEGKSTTVANLAATLALAEQNVVLVDGDMRKPSLHTFFGLDNEVGLSTLLTGQSALPETVKHVPLVQAGRGGDGSGPDVAAYAASASLDVLTGGPQPPNSGELIASRSFADLVRELEQKYSLVLIDSPAMLAVGDVAALSATIDGVIMVVDFERVKRPTLREGADLLGPLPCKKLGVIAAREHVRHSEYYRYSYYRQAQGGVGP